MAQKWKRYTMAMKRVNPQCGTYDYSMTFIACSKANAEKQAQAYRPIYGDCWYAGQILAISNPLIEGVDFRIMWKDTDTSHSYKVGVKLDEPDVDFIKAKALEEPAYNEVYWEMKRSGKIK